MKNRQIVYPCGHSNNGEGWYQLSPELAIMRFLLDCIYGKQEHATFPFLEVSPTEGGYMFRLAMYDSAHVIRRDQDPVPVLQPSFFVRLPEHSFRLAATDDLI